VLNTINQTKPTLTDKRQTKYNMVIQIYGLMA